MKAQLILIASAFLLVSNIAGAQEPGAPTAGMTGQDTMGHMGGHEMGYMTGQDTMGHMCGHGMMGHGMMRRGTMYRIMFALMDTDGDGTISLEEYQAAHAKIFKAMDANKDGKLTPEEMKMFWTGGSPTSHQ
jgi:hypothetical protein